MVNQHLTSGASVRPENDIMHSMGNDLESKNHVWILLRSKAIVSFVML